MRKLGLDLGSSSAGWAVNQDGEIKWKGAIIFKTGMSKGKTGGYISPTRDRRVARSKRNLIRARKYRKWELLKLLISARLAPLEEEELHVWSKYKKGRVRKFPENSNFIKWLACDFTYQTGGKYKNPYDIRVTALNRTLSKHELGRALYHIIQRRGYKDIGETDKETQKQIERRNEDGFKSAVYKHGTIAKALNEEFIKKGHRARNQYPLREEYQYELEEICKSQGYNVEKEGKEDYKDEFIKSLWKAIIWQRPLRTQKGNVGKCTLEPTKPRAAISHPIFEIFRSWQFINTIKYFDEKEVKQSLSQEFRNQLFEFFLKKDSSFKFEEIRKFLDKKFGKRQKYNYPVDKRTGRYDTSVPGMPVCKGLIGVLGEKAIQSFKELEMFHIGNAPKVIAKYFIYDLWHIVFDFDEQHLEKFGVEKLRIDNEVRIRKKKEVSVSPLVELKGKFQKGYSDLSLKALSKIIPFLKDGYSYNESVMLAKFPEVLGGQWESKKYTIFKILTDSITHYNKIKSIINISNNLIDKHKGLNYSENFAYRNFSYILQDDDVQDVKIACEGFFGDRSWKEEQNKQEIINEVSKNYQSYFYDTKRAYRKLPNLTEVFDSALKGIGIEMNGAFYHHSNRENKYSNNLEVNCETGDRYLPRHHKTGQEILPIPFIDSIKNPMFNKSMSILRKLINELILSGKVDEDTEVVIEVSRELNDNNKRAAIERYQNLRRDNREKYRIFLQEFKELENSDLNVEESIPIFEMWAEQTFEETNDENSRNVKNKSNSDILKEKEALTRYELWIEQKGQCMYTGRMISITQLFSDEIDIMHTIPRWLLPDNTMTNKTVGYRRYNRDLQNQKLPKECNNYYKDVLGWGTALEPRLEMWKRERDKWKWLYEGRIRPKGFEDEDIKNIRIQEKHYFKMHLDYWKEKIDRFEAEEVKDSWSRRQLVDTQLVSRYALEFLKMYFKKVSVQKGTITSDFRKLIGFQEFDEIKSRNKHTHHTIDAAVLTFIPVNSSRRELVLREYYEALENKDKNALERLRKTLRPFSDFSPQGLIHEIEENTLIVNYDKDTILKQAIKKVRYRGVIQYVKDKMGNLVFDSDGNRVIKYAKGDTVRSELFAQTYLGKIKDVERNSDGKPKMIDGKWEFKSGNDEFIYVKREDINKVKSSQKLINSIVDPSIKLLVINQKHQVNLLDFQGKIIRHVRIRTNVGREVKKRVNFKSKYKYKNSFYSEAGSVPYAALLQKTIDSKVVRELIPLASFELAKLFKEHGNLNFERYISEIYPQFLDWNKVLLRVGQKVLLFKDDNEFKFRKESDFIQKRMYIITQFSEGSIWLKYHLNALSKDDVKRSISLRKDELMRFFESKFDIPEVVIDSSIKDRKQQIEDYNYRRFRFDTISNSFRLKRLGQFIGEDKIRDVKNELDKYRAIPSTIEIEGETPLLKMSKDYWNFNYEGTDFNVSLLGEVTWL